MRQDVSQKKIVVLGATGATGRAVVAVALRAGHEVTALVRRPGSLAPADRLREVVWEDVADTGALTEAFRSARPDVVISALGGADTGPTTVCADAMRSAVPAMTGSGVRRLIVVSAHGVLETHDRSLYSRTVWAGVGEKMKDKEAMEPLITGSTLDWTIVRPPALKNTPPTGKYVVGEDLPIRLWHGIGRIDLAAFLVQEAERAEFVRRYPRIRR